MGSFVIGIGLGLNKGNLIEEPFQIVAQQIRAAGGEVNEACLKPLIEKAWAGQTRTAYWYATTIQSQIEAAGGVADRACIYEIMKKNYKK